MATQICRFRAVATWLRTRPVLWAMLLYTTQLGGVALAQGGNGAVDTGPLRFVSGALTLKVENYDDARTRTLEMVETQSGVFLDGKTMVTENGRRHGWVRFQVAVDRLPALLTLIRSLGTPNAEAVNTRENRGEYEGLGRRVTQLEKHQSRLEGLLSDKKRLRGSDALYLQERLFRAEVDSSLLEQRQTDMLRRRDFATVQVDFFEPIPVNRMYQARVDIAAHFGNAKRYAEASLSRFLGRIATAGAYALVFAPFWVPAVLGVFLLLRLLWIRLKRSGILDRLLSAVRWVYEQGVLLVKKIRPHQKAETASDTTDAAQASATVPESA